MTFLTLSKCSDNYPNAVFYLLKMKVLLIFILVASFQANATISNLKALQSTVVTGKVLDENGEPLPGVSVTIKNTTIGTTTTIDGNYSLNIPPQHINGTLVFSFLGYTNKEISISGKTQINISLVPDQRSLEEVVVVGYGTQAKRDITGSIGSVSSKDIEKRQAIDVLD